MLICALLLGACGKSEPAPVVEESSAQAESVEVIESCTAGMVSEMLTEVSGSSEVFEYGVSAYSNRIKAEVLKISQNVLSNADTILSQKVANIETVCKMLDVQSDIVKKMLKDDLEGKSKDIDNL